MEKLIKHICPSMPACCLQSNAASAPDLKQNAKQTEPRRTATEKEVKQPWSVFAGHYWI